jgi:predicted RNA-binding Zn-ribbon protein involved in translation (DUF1610 family)
VAEPVRPGADFPVEFLAAIEAAAMAREGRPERDEVRFRCPADGHEDIHPSARWNGEKATWRCDACGAGGGAIDLADRLGIERPGDPSGRPRETRYAVRDESGALVATHVRHDLADGTKRVWWERPDGRKGLGGMPLASLPLYGVEAIDGAASVVVTEGEKARDALARRGVPVVGTVTGAESAPGNGPLAPLLRVPTVYLWPDNDEPGRKHMRKVAGLLARLGHPDLRVIAWPEAPPKGDAADFGGDPAALLATATRLPAIAGQPSAELPAPPRRTRWSAPDLIAADLPDPRWAVPDLIPEGLTVLAGRPKKGKSRLALCLALAAASGLPALDWFEVDGGAPVLFVGLEDGPRRLRDRLDDLLGARPAPPTLELWTDLPKIGDGCEDHLQRWIAGNPDARLIVLDTYQRIRKPIGPRDPQGYAVDYDEAAGLQRIAMDAGMGIILILHTRKSIGAADPFDDVMGTTGNTAAADAIAVLDIKPNDATGRLLVTGRDIEQAEHAVETDRTSGGWRRVGDLGDVQRSAQRTAILAALRAGPPDGLKPRQIAEYTRFSANNVRQLLLKMRNAG